MTKQYDYDDVAVWEIESFQGKTTFYFVDDVLCAIENTNNFDLFGSYERKDLTSESRYTGLRYEDMAALSWWSDATVWSDKAIIEATDRKFINLALLVARENMSEFYVSHDAYRAIVIIDRYLDQQDDDDDLSE